MEAVLCYSSKQDVSRFLEQPGKVQLYSVQLEISREALVEASKRAAFALEKCAEFSVHECPAGMCFNTAALKHER